MPGIERSFNLASNEAKENSYEHLIQQRIFLDRVSAKYSEHTKLLTNTKNFNHMLKEIDRFNNYYQCMLDTMKNADFDFEEQEKYFDRLIEEDNAMINHHNRN